MNYVFVCFGFFKYIKYVCQYNDKVVLRLNFLFVSIVYLISVNVGEISNNQIIIVQC